MVDQVELLPCPFPHKVKRGPFVEVDDVDFCIVRVSCGDCGCAGPFVNLTTRKADEAKAISLWNRRTPTTPERSDD